MQTDCCKRFNSEGSFGLTVISFFNIFGLGHLLMRNWSKGLMYLAISVIIWYMCGWTFVSSNLMITLLSVAVFFFQAMDIFRIIYTPED